MARSDGVLSGIHARRRCGRTDAPAAGRSRYRKPRCGWPRPRWRTATPPCPSSVANSDQPRDALPVRRAAGPVARARREGPRPLNRSALDRDAARKCPNERSRHMLIGYARVSKADGSQSLDLQRDALRAPTSATSTTTSRPASATTARDSTAAGGRSGRATCSSSGSSTASAAPSPTWSTPSWARRLSGV